MAVKFVCDTCGNDIPDGKNAKDETVVPNKSNSHRHRRAVKVVAYTRWDEDLGETEPPDLCVYCYIDALNRKDNRDKDDPTATLRAKARDALACLVERDDIEDAIAILRSV